MRPKKIIETLAWETPDQECKKMKNIMFNLKKYIPRLSVIRSLIFVLGFGYVGFAYASLLPGPVTGSQDGEAIGGYVSHAQFEDGCTHCHAPLHCVTEDRCQDCHVEVAEEKAEMTGLHGMLPGTNRCQNCHVEHEGRDADITTLAFKRIDHASLANFSLDYHQADYSGEAMDCQSCHSQDDYRQASLDCVSCHAENDHDQMAAHIEEHGIECLSCHDGKTRLANFEHNVQAFNLTGAHTEVECKECHVDPGLQYNEAPTACVNCHTEEQRPDSHPQFGADCQRCHTTTAFAPARLTQHTFSLQHVEGTATECQDCHKTTYAAADCTGCHTENGRVEAEHAVMGIVDVSNCIACHTTGMVGEMSQVRNFPAKVGIPPGSSSQGNENGGQTGQNEQATLPSPEPTFASKDAGQGPYKEQEGASSQP
jgi:hypothetical protein